MLKLIVKLLCILALVAIAGCATDNASGRGAGGSTATKCYTPEPDYGNYR